MDAETEEATPIIIDTSSTFIMLWERGVLLAALLLPVPFILDKIFYKHLPKFAASLVYPSAIVAVESLMVSLRRVRHKKKNRPTQRTPRWAAAEETLT